LRSGRVALVVLALLVLGGGGALVASPRARVRWYALRMHSSDPEVAARARFKLFELDRPAIDEVLPELVAKELAARAGPLDWHVKVATPDNLVFDSNGYVSLPFAVQSTDPTALLLQSRVRRRVLYLEWVGRRPTLDPGPVSPIAIPLDDDLAPEVLAAVRAELGERAP
jgi:hypothetical protein